MRRGAAHGACDACLRRSWLVERLAGGIEIARRQRRPLRDVLALDNGALVAAVGGAKREAIEAQLAGEAARVLRERVGASSLVALCRHSAGYPAQLLDDRSAPAVLYLLARGGDPVGRLEELVGAASSGRQPAVAIVGTRKASPDGLAVASTLGRGIAAAGVTVVSGLALGVDSAAHEGALDAGGPTAAVLAGGADVPYPSSKRHVWARIAATGLVVSETPPGGRAFKWSFLARNRIIAGLASATIVVEAAERSGSLVTAELAAEIGRDVAAVPGSVRSWRCAGSNALLRDGATLIRDAQDALDLVLGVDGATDALRRAAERAVPPPPSLEPRLARLLTALDEGHDTVAALEASACSVAETRADLMELELLGLVERGAGGRLRRTASYVPTR